MIRELVIGMVLSVFSTAAFAAPPTTKPCRGKKCSMPQVRKVVGGEGFTCFLNQGAVKCMGNMDGETNASAFSNLLIPTQIPGLESGVTDIAAGPYNLLAIQNGNLMALGSNDYNQLSQGASAPRDITAPVLLLSGVKKAAISYYHGCALMLNGDVRCWGANFYGIFGNGSWSDVVAMADAPIVASNAQDLFVNEYATCILSAGSVKCAGYNGNGDIGAQTPSSDVPSFVTANIPGMVSEIQSGYFHSCARLMSGETYCWGFGAFGELGDQSTNRYPNFPRLASEIPLDAEAIYVQNYTTCFKKSGVIRCVGWNQNNVITPDSTQTVLASQAISGLQGQPLDMIRDISGQRGGNYAHRCVISTLGLECWGSNEYGELGNGSLSPAASPQMIVSW